MSRYELSLRGKHAELGWDAAPIGSFFARVYDGSTLLPPSIAVGFPGRVTASLEQLEEWLGDYGPLPQGLRRRLVKDRNGEAAIVVAPLRRRPPAATVTGHRASRVGLVEMGHPMTLWVATTYPKGSQL